MIRRNRRELPSLSKKLVKVDLIGGSAQNGAVCFGYSQDENGLTVCPAPAKKHANSLFASEFYSAKWHPSFMCPVLAYTNGDFVAWYRQNNYVFYVARTVPGEPFTVEARNAKGDPLLVSVCGNKMGFYNGSTAAVSSMQLPLQLCGGTVHCGRLFAVDGSDRYKVVWSGLRVTDWDDGIQGSGFVSLDRDAGKVLKIENFGDDLLCVREYGFTVMHAMADSRNFRIAPSHCVVCTGNKITVGGMLGQKYYFVSSGGLYSYDGSKIELIYALNDVFTKCEKAYVFDDGYVYADCEYNGKKCIMRFDVQSKTAVFFGEDCYSPFLDNGDLFCVKGNEFYQLSAANEEENRLWKSARVDICGRQVLKTLWVRASGNVCITVNSGDARRTFQGCGKITVNMPGNDFTVEVTGHGKVERLLAEFEVRK